MRVLRWQSLAYFDDRDSSRGFQVRFSAAMSINTLDRGPILGSRCSGATIAQYCGGAIGRLLRGCHGEPPQNTTALQITIDRVRPSRISTMPVGSLRGFQQADRCLNLDI